MKNNKIYTLLLKIAFVVLLLFLVFNKHSKSKNFTYHSETWADKGGYYVYLPAALKYDFNVHNFPDSIDTKTGNGFILDYEHNKVKTKYTCGVALLQLPFYVCADLLAKPLLFKPNGFSEIYNYAINVASIFYLFIGLYFLIKFINFYFSNNISLLVAATLFLATNLFYYAIDETGMTHVYSFALFSVFLFLIKSTKFLTNITYKKLFLIGLVSGLIILIRPTNALFLATYLFLDANSFNKVLIRVKRLFRKDILISLIAIFTVFVPQLLYWKLTYGSYFNYSYNNEGFNFLSPNLLLTLFSPNNGLFLYTPLYLLVLLVSIYMVVKKKENGLFLLGLFLGITYVFSSWWDWSFGCSFGARSYVEYLAIFSLVLAQLYGCILTGNNGLYKIIFMLLILFFIGLNLKMIYSYDECYMGKGDWDWNAYIGYVLSPTK